LEVSFASLGSSGLANSVIPDAADDEQAIRDAAAEVRRRAGRLKRPGTVAY
jgi:hypothetical protein